MPGSTTGLTGSDGDASQSPRKWRPCHIEERPGGRTARAPAADQAAGRRTASRRGPLQRHARPQVGLLGAAGKA